MSASNRKLRELEDEARALESIAERLQRTLTNPAFVDVELEPVSITIDSPIVEVQIVPAGTRRFEHLKTLAEISAVKRARPKHELETKLDRAIAAKAARLEDVRKLRAWAKAVKDRDRWTDQKTGQRVLSTRSLDPLRAEAHHIVSKDDWAVRYDIRNGICLSFATHFAVERHELRIEGTEFFEVDGCRYIDATFPVRFVPA